VRVELNWNKFICNDKKSLTAKRKKDNMQEKTKDNYKRKKRGGAHVQNIE
jgi:hypothetical protein